ncbi:MAG: alpha/beta hydrolase [Gemmataceae bacterium]
MFAETTFVGADQTLNVASGPKNGPTLVALHGVVRCWQDFGNVLPSLALRSHVLAIDHRGHGRSSWAPRYLVADYVADAVAAIRALKAPAAIIGHSLGALVAIGVAAELPDQVQAIILEDPPSQNFLARTYKTTYHAQWSAMQSLAGSTTPIAVVAKRLAETRLPNGVRIGDMRDAASLRFVARCLRDLDPQVLAPVLEYRWLEGFDLLEAARRVRCPALLLAGDANVGGMLPSEDARCLEAALSDCTRIDLPNVGHLIHASAPDTYLRLALHFLDSLDPLGKQS